MNDKHEQTAQEPYEELEAFDDYCIESDELAAEIEKIQGKPNMSLAGYAALANEEGIDVDQCTYELIPETNAVLCVVSGVNRHGKRRWASHYEPKSNEHQWAKAFSKAQRNLFKIFLYGHWKVKEAFEKWEASQKNPSSRERQQTTPKGQAKAQKETATDKARNAAFAKYNARKPALEERGITEEIFKAGVYTHYKVKSSNEMTQVQCRDLLKSLDGEFADWVLALSPAKASKTKAA